MATVPQIHVRFKRFDKDMRDAWESYYLVNVMAQNAHQRIKNKEDKPPKVENLCGSAKRMSAQDYYGALSHLIRKAQPRTSLQYIVACYEDYMSWLVATVLKDNPGLMKNNSTEQSKEAEKLLNIIIDASDRTEAIDRIIEEKVRGIFYGDPKEVLTKGKYSIDFGSYFNSKCTKQVGLFGEIMARRNLIVHNDGRVDRKYLREVKGTSFKEGQAIEIPESYIKEAVILLRGIAAKATEIVLLTHYKRATPSGKLAERIKQCKSLPAI